MSTDRWDAKPRRPDVEHFAIRGEVDGVAVEATWSATDGLDCPPQLLQRAQAVVAMGDRFRQHPDGPSIVASLDGRPSSILLTLLRACSRVTAVEITHRLQGASIDARLN